MKTSFKLFIKLICFTLLFSNCASNKYKLEKNAPFNLKEAFYQKWTAGIKGGGSGLNISIHLEKDDPKTFQIKGVHFMSNYSKLKLGKPNTYQGFIKTKENSEKTNIDGVVEKTNKETSIEIPFELKKDEAVITYETEGKKKYFKILLKKKEPANYPM